ncbi:MAG: hypothetical protein AW07_00269 [Candidatus Accumulibacter sp. SK-11]|nr:MAG: hypothetical protein AW07_00269 [Candidatus Accumulibacter sp. SK-11]
MPSHDGAGTHESPYPRGFLHFTWLHNESRKRRIAVHPDVHPSQIQAGNLGAH